MSRCGICDTVTSSRKLSISCSGVCKKRYHLECVGISSDVTSLVTTVPGLSWKCKVCLSFDDKGIENKMQEIFDKQCSTLFQQFTEKIESLKLELIKLTSEKLEEKFSQFHSSSSLPDHPLTFSETLRSKSKIVVKPKLQNQQNSQTKSDILRNIDPADTQIYLNKVKHISNGGVLLGYSNADDATKFKLLAEEKLSENYEIRELKDAQPRFKVVGMSEEYKEESFLLYIAQQNGDVFTSVSELKLIRFWPTKNNKKVYQATLQVDPITYKKVINRGNLLVALDSCRVYEDIYISRCFRCNSYHHTSKYCKNNVSCPLCSEPHDMKDCKVKNENLYKCSNCCNLKSKHKLDINVNHAVWNYGSCYAYKQAIEKLKFEVIRPQ